MGPYSPQFKELALRAAIHVDSRPELPQLRKPASYACGQINGTTRIVKVKDTERMILEQLRMTPLYCASRINLSAYIDKLRKRGVCIVTHWHTSQTAGGKFGVYAMPYEARLLGIPGDVQPLQLMAAE